jgi:hypothetical protein
MRLAFDDSLLLSLASAAAVRLNYEGAQFYYTIDCC